MVLAQSNASDFPADFGFDRFTVAPFNRFAYTAARAAVDSPGRFSPCVFSGPVGVGKSHLLLAIGRAVANETTGRTVCYMTGRDFCDEVAAAERGGQVAELRRKLAVQTLLLDDIGDMAGDPTAETVLVDVLDQAPRGGQVVLAYNHPLRLNSAMPRLESRLRAAIAVPIPLPDLEGRIAILRQRAQTEGLQLSDWMISALAGATTDLRQLTGALLAVRARSELLDQVVSDALVTGVVESLCEGNQPPSIEVIIEHVAEHFGFSPADLKSKSRKRPLVWARQVAQWLVRELTDLSYPAIGQAFGDRDHTTVMHSVEKVGKLRSESASVLDLTNNLASELQAKQASRRLLAV